MAVLTPPSDETMAAIRRSAAAMSTRATALVEAQHAWFTQLSADDRSWIGVIAQSGIRSFLNWLGNPSLEQTRPVEIFADAPRELARRITLEQTLDLLRTVIEVVEQDAPDSAQPGERAMLREAVLRYSREVAFGAAHVYARAAESRGAWDARLESLVVDAVVRGEPDESLGSRVNALGWADIRGVTVVVGSSPSGGESGIVDPLRRAARHAGLEVLVSVEGRRMIAVIGHVAEDPLEAAATLADHFGAGPVVCGPKVPHLYAAGRSARDAIRGYEAAPAAPHSPRPCRSDDLVAVRAVAGDDKARRVLAARASGLLEAGSPLGDTVRSYLRNGSLEGTARDLIVHANTVRYRLARVHEMSGFDLTDADDAFAARLAIMFADLESAPRGRRGRADLPL